MFIGESLLVLITFIMKIVEIARSKDQSKQINGIH